MQDLVVNRETFREEGRRGSGEGEKGDEEEGEEKKIENFQANDALPFFFRSII